MKPLKYAKTDAEAAQSLGLSTDAFRKTWKNRAGNPGKGRMGYSVARWLKFVAEEKAKLKKATRDGDLRNDKLRVEIEILETKRDQLRGDLVPLGDVKEYTGRLVRTGLAALKQVEQAVKSIVKDADVQRQVRKAIEAAQERWKEQATK